MKKFIIIYRFTIIFIFLHYQSLIYGEKLQLITVLYNETNNQRMQKNILPV